MFIVNPLAQAAMLRPLLTVLGKTLSEPVLANLAALLKAVGVTSVSTASIKHIKPRRAVVRVKVSRTLPGLRTILPPTIRVQRCTTWYPSLLRVLLYGVGISAVVGCVYLFRKYSLRDLQSYLISYLKYEPKMNPDQMRVTFNDMPPNESRALKDHTHPEAAANRTGASLFIDRLSRCLGKTAYMIQKSRSDVRSGREGSRAYYWSKDLTIEPDVMELPENPLVAFVDVDEYVDMPSFLAKHAHPTIIYTFQPDQVAKVASNYSYTFDDKNIAHYSVTGGGGYSHPVWNYSSDHFVAENTFFGIPYRRVSYLVDRRSTAPDHELVFMCPVGTWFGFGAIFHWLWISGRRLTRLEPATTDGFLRMQISSLQGVKVSTGRVGYYNSSTIPVATDDTIATIARTSNYDLTMPQVLSFVDGDRQAAAALLDYHRVANGGEKRPVVCPVPMATRRYQFDPRNFDPKAKPSLVPFMSPLLHGAFAADLTVGNEEQCVEGRVEKVRPKELPLTPFVVNVMKEFIELLIPEAHLLDPVDYDEVMERQARPTQRRILAIAEAGHPKRVINMFQKKEAYPNIKDPRAISTINGVDKRDYSRYMYAFEKVLKTQPWYAFAKTPVEIAKRVVEICENCESHTTNSDFSRFDGHGSNMMRELEKMALMRAFRVEHHSEVLELHKGQYNLKAYATLGTEYFTAYSRASGSPETSLFNTLVNAFTAFLAFRMSKDLSGCFFTPLEAFSLLGIYGGDDGLTADLQSDTYKRAATTIGQELDVEPIRRGHGGVKFLARIYSPYVWFGDENSCCDIPRQISKFHVSVRMPQDVTPAMKFLEKIRSFVLSDENTPIIGDICRRVVGMTGEIAPNVKLAQLSTWLAQYDKKVQYPNTSATWMTSYCESVLPDFEYKKFRNWLDTCNTVESFLAAPMFMEPTPAKSDVPVVVDDVVLPYGVKIVAKPKRGQSNSNTNSIAKTTTTNATSQSTPDGKIKVSDSDGDDTKHIAPGAVAFTPIISAAVVGQPSGVQSGVPPVGGVQSGVPIIFIGTNNPGGGVSTVAPQPRVIRDPARPSHVEEYYYGYEAPPVWRKKVAPGAGAKQQ